MTKIPVERKRGMPWWAWLLIALAIAALLWLLFALFNNDEGEGLDAGAVVASPAATASPTPAASPSAATTAATATGDTITDPALILVPVAERPALVGRPVLIETVPVQSVPGDRTFLVGQDQDQPLLVVLDETQSAGQSEGQVDDNPGQTVSIAGQIQALPSMEEARQQWDLDDETLSQIEDDQVYVLATQVAVVDQAAGASPSPANAGASPSPRGATASASPTAGAMSASPAASPSSAAGATGASPAASPSPAAASGDTEPLADILVIIDTPDQPSLVGRRVQLTGVQVQSVVGDTTFWVGPSPDQQLFVVLEEDPSAGQTEGQVDVNAGQTVTLTGEIRQLPSLEEARAQWGLSEENSAQLENQQIYVHAEQVEITEQ